MNRTLEVIAGSDLVERPRRSRWPARLDYLQSASGLVLALFMWVHMGFVSSILFGKNALWVVARTFEGYFFFGHRYPVLVSIAAAGVLTLVIGHAALALRKFPINYRQFRTFRGHMAMMRHEDTTLWFIQVVTGFALFFLASVHLYIIMTNPGKIGPFMSSFRVWNQHLWPLYLLLLLAVEFHGGIGLYRLSVKWNWFGGANPDGVRHNLKVLKWTITVFFLAVGLATLATFIKIGIINHPSYGQRYVPTWQQDALPGQGGQAAPAAGQPATTSQAGGAQ